MRVSNDEFISKLEKQFAASTSSHSVFITKKRVSTEYDNEGDAKMADAAASGSKGSGYSVLIRATDGATDKKDKVKFSTLVPSSKLATFESTYLPMLKTSLSNSLRKRDKAKERKVDKILAQRRKELEENSGKVKVSGVGSKRGKGHRKRQRAEKSARKVRKEKAIAATKVKADGSATSANGPADVGKAILAGLGVQSNKGKADRK